MATERYSLVDLHQDLASFSNDTNINLNRRNPRGPELGSNVPASLMGADYAPMFNADVDALRDGGVIVAFANIFALPLGTDGKHTPPQEFDPLFGKLHRINQSLLLGRGKDLHKVTSAPELEESQRLGKTGLIYANEGIYGTKHTVLHTLWEKDVRSVGPLHNFDNEFGSTAYYETPEDLGLRPAGQSLVKEADEMGFIVDGAHASPRTIKGMLAVERTRPLVVTHTTAGGVDSHARAISDDLARAIAAEDGLIGVTPVGAFYGPVENGKRTMGRVAQHLAHLREVTGGVQSLAIGTDANGGLGAASRIGSGRIDKFTQELAPELLARDFSERDVHEIFSGNAIRYLQTHLPR